MAAQEHPEETSTVCHVGKGLCQEPLYQATPLPLAESTARSGRKDTWREANQKYFFWEHEKMQPTKTFLIPCRLCPLFLLVHPAHEFRTTEVSLFVDLFV